MIFICSWLMWLSLSMSSTAGFFVTKRDLKSSTASSRVNISCPFFGDHPSSARKLNTPSGRYPRSLYSKTLVAPGVWKASSCPCQGSSGGVQIWGLEPKGLIDQQLLGSVDNMILSADDHVYVHRIVVDNNGVVICRHTVPFEDDDIFIVPS